MKTIKNDESILKKKNIQIGDLVIVKSSQFIGLSNGLGIVLDVLYCYEPFNSIVNKKKEYKDLYCIYPSVDKDGKRTDKMIVYFFKLKKVCYCDPIGFEKIE
jgi:hypothetical protein